MRFTPGLLLVLGCCLALLTIPAASAAQAPPAMSILADAVDVNLDTGSTQAKGHAHVTYGKIELFADEVSADQRSGSIVATGHLSIQEEGRKLEGDKLTYDFLTDRGSLTNARAHEQGVIIRGERIDFSPQGITAHRSSFTTCDRPKPDYSLDANEISLTATQSIRGQTPKSGRLTLDHARVIYHGHSLFTLPRYSVPVGQIGQQGTSPFPTTGFDREDGAFAMLSYTLARSAGPTQPVTADLSYRLTTARGVRGAFRLRRDSGPFQLTAAVVRREASVDRDLQPDDFTTSIANVLINREPEFRGAAPSLPLGRRLSLRTEVTWGAYSETQPLTTDIRARARRTSGSALLSLTPYRIAKNLSLSHALGWRESGYSSGDHLSIRFLRHTIGYALSRDTQFALSYITRRGEGQTPFLFDRIEVGRELLADVRYRLNPKWRIRVVDLYDLQRRDTRDMLLSVTRTVHCLDYTVGWRKARGAFFVGINITPPSSSEREHVGAGASATDNRISPFGEP